MLLQIWLSYFRIIFAEIGSACRPSKTEIVLEVQRPLVFFGRGGFQSSEFFRLVARDSFAYHLTKCHCFFFYYLNVETSSNLLCMTPLITFLQRYFSVQISDFFWHVWQNCLPFDENHFFFSTKFRLFQTYCLRELCKYTN